MTMTMKGFASRTNKVQVLDPLEDEKEMKSAAESTA